MKNKDFKIKKLSYKHLFLLSLRRLLASLFKSHKAGVIVLSVFFAGCLTQKELPQLPAQTAAAPPVFLLEDESGNKLGYASALRLDVLVAPDHLLQVSRDLYVDNRAIKVLARDFRHDLFFFTVPNMKLASVPSWSNQPPGVGNVLWWGESDLTNFAPVFSAKVDFMFGQTQLKNLMALSVLTQAGDSGRPLYEKSTGQIYGMLVASNALEDVSYFVRSDIILTLAKEYLD